MNTTTNAPAWFRSKIPNRQFLPCSGYLRGVAIDVVNSKFNFMLLPDIENFFTESPTPDSHETHRENRFFSTRLPAFCFPENQFQLNLILDWEAAIYFQDEEKLEFPNGSFCFTYTAKNLQNHDKRAPESNIHVAAINAQKENAFEVIFNQISAVTPNTFSTHTDVIKLHKNGFNPFYYGKTFYINNVKTEVLTPLYTSAKSATDTCRNCEFRYMCIDNRLPTQRQTDGLWYHTTECNYNPYIAKWKGEEGYRTLAECGVKSDETGFSIDHERIAKINEELWGEE